MQRFSYFKKQPKNIFLSVYLFVGKILDLCSAVSQCHRSATLICVEWSISKVNLKCEIMYSRQNYFGGMRCLFYHLNRILLWNRTILIGKRIFDIFVLTRETIKICCCCYCSILIYCIHFINICVIEALIYKLWQYVRFINQTVWENELTNERLY